MRLGKGNDELKTLEHKCTQRSLCCLHVQHGLGTGSAGVLLKQNYQSNLL